MNRVLHFLRDGEPARIEVNSPEGERIFALVAKFQELERWYPTQARIIEETDRLLSWLESRDEIMLAVEEMTPADVRDAGAGMRRSGLSDETRLTLTLMLFAAINHAPGMSHEQRDDLKDAWMEGSGVTWEAVERVLRRQRGGPNG